MNNIKNNLVSSDIIEGIINDTIKFTYKSEPLITVHDINLYRRAFKHKSFFIVDTIDRDDEDAYCTFDIDIYDDIFNSNERLEFLGDSILGMVVSEYLFDNYPNKNEGFLTDCKIKLINKKMLSFLSQKLNFNKYLLLSTDIERSNGRNNPRLLEDVFESFIAALYKDQMGTQKGLYVCKKFIISLLNKFVDFDTLITTNENYKSILLKFFHNVNFGNPVYTLLYLKCNLKTINGKEFASIIFVDKDLIDKDKFNVQKLQTIDKQIRKQIENIDQSLIKDEAKEKLKNNNLLITGIGIDKKIKDSEQLCSKNCLENFEVNQ